MIAAASAKPIQYIEPIDESVYRLFDVKYSILESAGGEIYKIFQAVPKNRNVSKSDFYARCECAIFRVA